MLDRKPDLSQYSLNDASHCLRMSALFVGLWMTGSPTCLAAPAWNRASEIPSLTPRIESSQPSHAIYCTFSPVGGWGLHPSFDDPRAPDRKRRDVIAETRLMERKHWDRD